MPFGQYQVTDRQYDKLHFQIHDYFLAKTVDKLRVGGIMAFITTSGTMDKKSENAMGQNSGLLSSLTDWNSTLAGYADSISSGVVMPIALTVLALFMVLELYNFTQTIAMNGGSTAFTIQQVALVMLKITLCRWAPIMMARLVTFLTSSGVASVATSKSFGLAPISKSRTAPPTIKALYPAS